MTFQQAVCLCLVALTAVLATETLDFELKPAGIEQNTELSAVSWSTWGKWLVTDKPALRLSVALV